MENNKYTFHTLLEIFLVSFKLGLTSFAARRPSRLFPPRICTKRKWMDERIYGDLVALCQFLPGPASSQVGMGVGLLRGGGSYYFMDWVHFTVCACFSFLRLIP